MDKLHLPPVNDIESRIKHRKTSEYDFLSSAWMYPAVDEITCEFSDAEFVLLKFEKPTVPLPLYDVFV